MSRKVKALLVAGAVALAAVGGFAFIGDDDGSEVPITGDELVQATEAALAVYPDGTVSETEKGDEEGAYEVEVTLPDGSQIDVHFDENFTLLSTEADGPGDEDD